MILVTGGTGLLGTYLLQHLSRGDQPIRILIRDKKRIPPQFSQVANFNWVMGDVLDTPSLADAMEGVQQVFHLAGAVSFEKRDYDNLMAVNIEGTANVCEAARVANVAKLLHVSSIAALGRTTNGQPISETTTWVDDKLNSNYALSKFLGEKEVWRSIEEGLNAVIINPGVILGEGNWETDSSQFVKKIDKNSSFYSDAVNGFVDARDVVEIMIKLMDSEIEKERFVVTSENVPYKDLFSQIANALNKKEPFFKLTPTLLKSAAFFDAIVSFFTRKKRWITMQMARTASHQFYYDNSKISSALSFDFIPITDTVLHVCAQYKDQQK